MNEYSKDYTLQVQFIQPSLYKTKQKHEKKLKIIIKEAFSGFLHLRFANKLNQADTVYSKMTNDFFAFFFLYFVLHFNLRLFTTKSPSSQHQ